MSARLDELGRLSTWWRPRLAPTLAARVDGAVVWDLLPQEHEAAMDWPVCRPSQRVTVRFVDAEGRTVSHWNKLLKGSLVRWILREQPPGPAALADFEHPLGYRFDADASSLTTDPATVVLCARARRLPSVSARAHFKVAGIPVHVQPVFFVISGLFGLRYLDFGLDVVLVWIATSASCRSSSTSWATAWR